MGTHTTQKMLATLNTLAPFQHRAPLFTGMDTMLMGARPRGVFDDMDRMFAEADARQEQFLNEMGAAEPSGYSRSFSYSSRSVQANGEPTVVERSEQYRGADGEVMRRTVKTLGDKTVEETVKGGETQRMLHNLTEEELEGFHAGIQAGFTRPFGATLEAPEPAALPDALQRDLESIQGAQ